MRQTTGNHKGTGERIVKAIRRATRKHYSSEEKPTSSWTACALRGEDSMPLEMSIQSSHSVNANPGNRRPPERLPETMRSICNGIWAVASGGAGVDTTAA